LIVIKAQAAKVNLFVVHGVSFVQVLVRASDRAILTPASRTALARIKIASAVMLAYQGPVGCESHSIDTHSMCQLHSRIFQNKFGVFSVLHNNSLC
jgi:hypothetical protein